MRAPLAGLSPTGSVPAARRPRAPCRRRLIAGLALVIAGVVLMLSAFTPWWYYSGRNGSDSASALFLPGTSYWAAASTGSQSASGTETYQSGGLGTLTGLYVTTFVLMLASGTLLLLAGIVALLAEAGILRGWARGRLVIVVALLVFLVPLTMITAVAWEQPVLYADANPGGACPAGSAPGTGSPCSAFWGSEHYGQLSVAWGAGAGWDLAVFGAILAVVGGASWWSVYYNPWEQGDWFDEATRRAAPLAPGPSPPLFYGTAPVHGPASRARTPAPSSYLPPIAPATPGGAALTGTGSSLGVGRVASAPGGITLRTPPREPGPAAPYRPPAELRASTEVGQLTLLKGQLDAGQMTADEFARSKARLLASTPPSEGGALAGAAPVAQELEALDSLRDAGALSGPEYLQFRRRVIVRR